MFLLKSVKSVNHFTKSRYNPILVSYCSTLGTPNSDYYYVSTPIYYVNAG